MKALTMILTVAVLVSRGPLPGQPLFSSGLPRLGGTLPGVEQALLRALETAGLVAPLVHIGADANGHLTVASLVFTYPGRGPEALPALQGYAWGLIQASLAAAPSLDELDLSGFAQTNGPLDPARTDVTFSAAVSRDEFQLMAKRVPAPVAMSRLSRVWYDPSLTGAPDLNDRAEMLLPIQPGHHNRAAGIIWGQSRTASTAPRTVALTFDDGPFPIYTTLLVDTLERLRLKATFFLVGERVRQYPYFARAIVSAGHEVGNHTFDHVNLTRLSADQVASELVRAQEVIFQVTGVVPRYFRPPGGDYNAIVLRAAKNLGLAVVFWTDDPADYRDLGQTVLKARLLARVTGGGILLLHEGVDDTIHILPAVEAVLRQEGFAATTVSGLVAQQRLRN